MDNLTDNVEPPYVEVFATSTSDAGLGETNVTSSSNRSASPVTVHPIAVFLEVYYSLFIIIFGTIGNLLSLAVLSRKAFSSRKTSLLGVCLRFLALADLTALYTGPLYFTAMRLFNHNFREVNEASCKFHKWASYCAVDLSAWTLVVVTTYRLTLVIWPKKKIFTRRSTLITLFIIFVAILGINSPSFFMYGTSRLPPRTRLCKPTTETYRDFASYVWPWMFSVKFTILPGTILLVMNVILVVRFVRGRQILDEQSGINKRKYQVRQCETSDESNDKIDRAVDMHRTEETSFNSTTCKQGTKTSCVKGISKDKDTNQSQNDLLLAVPTEGNSQDISSFSGEKTQNIKVSGQQKDNKSSSQRPASDSETDGMNHPSPMTSHNTHQQVGLPVSETNLCCQESDPESKRSQDGLRSANDHVLRSLSFEHIKALDVTSPSFHMSSKPALAVLQNDADTRKPVKSAVNDDNNYNNNNSNDNSSNVDDSDDSDDKTTTTDKAQLGRRIVYKSRRRPWKLRRQTERRKLTLTVIVLNAMFILCNLPITVYMAGRGYMFTGKKSSSQYVMEIFANYFLYTNNATNFILYCITGSRFREELKKMFSELWSLVSMCFRRMKQI